MKRDSLDIISLQMHIVNCIIFIRQGIMTIM